MRTLALAGMILFAQYAEAKEAAILFSSMSDATYDDPIDRNAVWRGTAMTYQSIRNLGITSENVIILYNDAKPDYTDISIPLRAEISSKTISEGKDSELEKVFREQTKDLTDQDTIILCTSTHGGDNGILYPSYGRQIPAKKMGELLSTTKARAVVFYLACYSGSMLQSSSAPNTVQVSCANHTLAWIDRNYSSSADFFRAFSTPSADRDHNGKVSIEEAAAYAHKNWGKYMDGFLEKYLLTTYVWPKNFFGYNDKEEVVEKIDCDPQIKRGQLIPLEWTLEKKP